MRAGTSKKQKYIPVHQLIADVLPSFNISPADTQLLLPFHSVTGSDTTSFILGHSKKTAFMKFVKHKELLAGLGVEPLTTNTIKKVESFICKLYDVYDTDSVDKVRAQLFAKFYVQEKLPPTHDALQFHIKRSHYQALIWMQADMCNPNVPSPTTLGWRIEEDTLVPTLTVLPPVPKSCMELISCGCKTTCMSLRCKCRKTNLSCTSACHCDGLCNNTEN